MHFDLQFNAFCRNTNIQKRILPCGCNFNLTSILRGPGHARFTTTFSTSDRENTVSSRKLWNQCKLRSSLYLINVPEALR